MSENTLNKIEQSSSVFKPEIKSDSVIDKNLNDISEKSTFEKKAEKEGQVKDEIKESANISSSVSLPVTDDYHLRREVEIDACLSDGLSEAFLAMPLEKQKIFKAEGEATARKINILLDAAKINVNKIISLIKKWLKIITGINRFFLDQEAKIKADKIIKIKNKL